VFGKVKSYIFSDKKKFYKMFLL